MAAMPRGLCTSEVASPRWCPLGRGRLWIQSPPKWTLTHREGRPRSPPPWPWYWSARCSSTGTGWTCPARSGGQDQRAHLQRLRGARAGRHLPRRGCGRGADLRRDAVGRGAPNSPVPGLALLVAGLFALALVVYRGTSRPGSVLRRRRGHHAEAGLVHRRPGSGGDRARGLLAYLRARACNSRTTSSTRTRTRSRAGAAGDAVQSEYRLRRLKTPPAERTLIPRHRRSMRPRRPPRDGLGRLPEAQVPVAEHVVSVTVMSGAAMMKSGTRRRRKRTSRRRRAGPIVVHRHAQVRDPARPALGPLERVDRPPRAP